MMLTKSINVLIYHELCNSSSADGYKYAFTAEDFRTHLKLISDSKICCHTTDDLVRQLNPSLHNKDKSKTLLISFDDGHKSNYELALPLLLEYGLKANFFITTDWINKHGYMMKEEITQLSNQGMSIQSHAKTHNFLDEMSREDVLNELSVSKETLENIIGQAVSCISIPGGRLNRTVIECAKEVGYKAILTSVPYQLAHVSGIWMIGRVGLRYPLSILEFEKIIISSRPFIMRKKLETTGKNVLKRILGGPFYYKLWKLIVKR